MEKIKSKYNGFKSQVLAITEKMAYTNTNSDFRRKSRTNVYFHALHGFSENIAFNGRLLITNWIKNCIHYFISWKNTQKQENYPDFRTYQSTYSAGIRITSCCKNDWLTDWNTKTHLKESVGGIRMTKWQEGWLDNYNRRKIIEYDTIQSR